MKFFGSARLSAAALLGTALWCLAVAPGCGGGAPEFEPTDLADQPVIYDFSERLPAARVFRESAFVDLGTPGARRKLVAGWGDDETKGDGTTYVWAVARRAELDLVVVDTAAPRLQFRAWPFWWDDAPDQIVTVFVNGRDLGSLRLEPGPRDYSLRVPRGTLVADINRVAFEFSYVEEAGAHRRPSSDHRTLAAAFDFVGCGEKPDVVGDEVTVQAAPMARDDAMVLAPGTGLVFAFNRTSATTLSFGLDVDGARPPEGAKIVVWSQRAGSPQVELAADDLSRVLGRRRNVRIDAGEGRLEIGFAVTAGAAAPADGVWNLVVSKPHLHAEKGVREKISNVLMVVVDTLRADRLGVYGSTLATPNIDGLAARGVTFRQAYSHIPITGPSHASIFTSLIPTEHGVHNNGQILGTGLPVMAEILGGEGRNTAGVVSLGVLETRFGFGRGFETYLDDFHHDWWKDAAEVNAEVFDLLDGSLPEPFFLWVHYSDPHEPYAPPGLEYPRIQVELNGVPVGELLAAGRGRAFDLALLPGHNELRFVDLDPPGDRSFRLTTFNLDDPEVEARFGAGWRARERALAASLHMAAFPATVVLHNPGGGQRRVGLEVACQPELPLVELQRRYGLEVEYVDREIGRLLDFMDQRGLLDNTLVVVLSDHGEGLGDHNHLGHISQLYNSLLHVAFIAAFPGHLPQGVVIDQPVAMVDVLPTVLEIMSLALPERISGASLLPLIRGDGGPPLSIVAETFRPEAYSEKRALVGDGYKYIHSWTDDQEWEELYDLTADPGELHDLSAIEAERLAAMRDALQNRLLAAVPAEVVEAVLTDAEIERLRALGYIH